MSLLKRLFGGKSFEELRAEADQRLAEERYGEAKLTYEKALDRGKDADEEARAAVRARIDECCDAIAKRRIAMGEQHIAEGELELAREELEGAVDTAVSEDVAGQAQRLLDDMERKDAVERAEELEVTDEEKLAVLAGSWEDAQAEEYAEYGETFDRALVEMHDEKHEDARAKLEATLEAAEAPRYLWLEVGRARLLTGDLEAGEKAMRVFLETLEEGEGGDARLSAHRELAELCDERGDEEGALAELEAAVEELPEDPRPLIAMGHYFRTRGHPAEAVQVLETALDVMGESRPEWRVLQELGLACAASGDEERAIQLLESVLSMLVARNHYDYPPETAVALARLHEKHGKPERAADLFRSLTRGSDRRNHLAYHLEAARVLASLGLDEEARRMRERATALAKGNEEAERAVARRIAELDGVATDPADEAHDDEADEREPAAEPEPAASSPDDAAER